MGKGREGLPGLWEELYVDRAATPKEMIWIWGRGEFDLPVEHPREAVQVTSHQDWRCGSGGMGMWEARAMNGWRFPGRLHGLGRPEGPDRPLGAPSPHGQMGKEEGVEEGDSLEGVATLCPLSQPDSYCTISHLRGLGYPMLV